MRRRARASLEHSHSTDPELNRNPFFSTRRSSCSNRALDLFNWGDSLTAGTQAADEIAAFPTCFCDPKQPVKSARQKLVKRHLAIERNVAYRLLPAVANAGVVSGDELHEVARVPQPTCTPTVTVCHGFGVKRQRDTARRHKLHHYETQTERQTARQATTWTNRGRLIPPIEHRPRVAHR